jgi:hypothetical protein
MVAARPRRLKRPWWTGAGRLRSDERVLDPHAADSTARLEVPGEEACRAGAPGRLEDEGVPEPEGMALLER